jgi:hypothetical protein
MRYLATEALKLAHYHWQGPKLIASLYGGTSVPMSNGIRQISKNWPDAHIPVNSDNIHDVAAKMRASLEQGFNHTVGANNDVAMDARGYPRLGVGDLRRDIG